MKNITFTGKADIVFNKSLYQKALKTNDIKEICKFPNYRFDDGRFCKNAFTEGINTCTAGYIHNGKKGFMFHIAPEYEENTTPKFINLINELKKNASEKLTAFIFGGRDQMLGKEGASSFKAFDKIANILDNPDTDLSIIWGKTQEGFTDNFFANLNNSKFILSTGNNFDKKSIEDLYSIVEINPKHNLIING